MSNKDGTASSLSRLGVSHEKLLAKARCGAARALLKNTDMAPEDIADMVGYADTQTFTSICVLRTGYPPAELRRVSQGVST